MNTLTHVCIDSNGKYNQSNQLCRSECLNLFPKICKVAQYCRQLFISQEASNLSRLCGFLYINCISNRASFAWDQRRARPQHKVGRSCTRRPRGWCMLPPPLACQRATSLTYSNSSNNSSNNLRLLQCRQNSNNRVSTPSSLLLGINDNPQNGVVSQKGYFVSLPTWSFIY